MTSKYASVFASGGGVKGSSDGSSITIVVTNGAGRIYVDWPDGSFSDYPMPASGRLRIEIPTGMPSGPVTVTDMNIPDPSGTSFPI
jgi:hypothetical protein